MEPFKTNLIQRQGVLRTRFNTLIFFFYLKYYSKWRIYGVTIWTYEYLWLLIPKSSKSSTERAFVSAHNDLNIFYLLIVLMAFYIKNFLITMVVIL